MYLLVNRLLTKSIFLETATAQLPFKTKIASLSVFCIELNTTHLLALNYKNTFPSINLFRNITLF